MSAIRIKPLEWEDTPHGNRKARTPWGFYWACANGTWNEPGADFSQRDGITLASAQAACTKHYEDMVRPCIEEVTE